MSATVAGRTPGATVVAAVAGVRVIPRAGSPLADEEAAIAQQPIAMTNSSGAAARRDDRTGADASPSPSSQLSIFMSRVLGVAV